MGDIMYGIIISTIGGGSKRGQKKNQGGGGERGYCPMPKSEYNGNRIILKTVTTTNWLQIMAH